MAADMVNGLVLILPLTESEVRFREVMGWSMNREMARILLIDALWLAVWLRKPTPGLLFHLDRENQYCSTDCQTMLETYSMASSMSRKGNW